MSSRRMRIWLGAWAVVVLTPRVGLCAGPPSTAAERVPALEAQIAQRQAAVQTLERRKTELSLVIDANPRDAGANFQRLSEVRQTDRFISAYRREIEELDRQLAATRVQAESEASTPKRGSPKDGIGAGTRARSSSSEKPRSGAATATRANAVSGRDGSQRSGENEAGIGSVVETTDGGERDSSGLGAEEVRDFMRDWAMGRGGVPGLDANGAERLPALAVVAQGLDWSLDWLELSIGFIVGAAAGSSLPLFGVVAMRRLLPERPSLVGPAPRRQASVDGRVVLPSKQWARLADQAGSSIRLSVASLGLVAVLAAVQAAGSWTGFGPALGPPKPWGEVVSLIGASGWLAIALSLATRRSLWAALAGAGTTLIASSLAAARALTPFGGVGSLEWFALLIAATAAQLPALGYLWQLADRRAARVAVQRVMVLTSALGGFVGLAGAALWLLCA